MTTLALYNSEGKKVKDLDAPAEMFEGPVRKGLLYYTVLQQLAKRRAGTHETKTHGEIRGSTSKMYRQKGTGRARHGDRRSNLFVGGNKAFGPHPRRYGFKLPRTARRRGLLSVLALKQREGNLLVVQPPELKEPKTREALKFFQNLKVASGLLVLDEKNTILEKSVRNLPGFQTIPVAGLNVYDILRFEKLLVTQEALDKLKQRVKVA